MKKTVMVVLAVSAVLTGAWAAGTTEMPTDAYQYGVDLVRYQPSGILHVQELDPEVVAVFTDEGVDPRYLNVDPSLIPTDVRADIDAVVVDERDGLTEIIYPQLKDYLSRGSIEYAYVMLGTYRFKAAFGEFAPVAQM